MAIEFNILGFEIRLSGSNALTRNERLAIDPLVKDLGYKDIDDLVSELGYSSIRELASDYDFKSARDYFLADGWIPRLSQFDKNGKNPKYIK